MLDKFCQLISGRVRDFRIALRNSGTAAKGDTYCELPSLRVFQYVERAAPMKEIENSFANATRNASGLTVVVLLGMGGQGNTQLALEYCRMACASRKYEGVFWIDASSQNTVSGWL